MTTVEVFWLILFGVGVAGLTVAGFSVILDHRVFKSKDT